jgi:hypothetical protein
MVRGIVPLDANTGSVHVSDEATPLLGSVAVLKTPANYVDVAKRHPPLTPRWSPRSTRRSFAAWLGRFDAATTPAQLLQHLHEAKSTPGILDAVRTWDGACMTEIAPALQILCRHLELHNRAAFRASWCPHIAQCVMWGEGTFSPPLTREFFEKTYRDAVASPSVRLGLLISSATDVMAHMNVALEKSALLSNDMMRQELCLSSLRSSDANQQKLHCIDQRIEVPVHVAFPSCVRYNACRVGEHPVLSGGGSLQRLDGMSLLSLLFRVAARGRSAHNDSIAVLVFSGDSTLRETFLRLIHLIRYDGAAGGRKAPPFFDLPSWSDIMYNVFSNGDRIDLFASPFSGSPRRRESGIAEALRSQRQRLRSGERMPLLTMLFLFSKRTAMPRKELWDATRERRLESIIPLGLVVEGTLFWETERDSAFMTTWHKEAERRSAAASFPFVVMTGHPKIELCRSGHRDFVPKRVLVAHSAPLAPDGRRQPLNVFNARKNIEALHFMKRVADQRSTAGPEVSSLTAAVSSKETFVWDSVAVLDKASLLWMPGILPIDHIHLSCRMLPSSDRPQDPLMHKAVRLVDQWVLLVTRGITHSTLGNSSYLAHWETVVDALERNAAKLLLPPVSTPLTERWRPAGGKKRSIGHYVNLAADGRGCVDVGNELLIHELLLGLVGG